MRKRTGDTREMVDKYLAERVIKSWTEDFVDEDNGEVVTIERNEVLFEKGIIIDKDTATKIQFHIQCGDIENVLVSNQRRMGYDSTERRKKENIPLKMKPFIAKISTNEKSKKVLLYAEEVAQVLDIVKDWMELNSEGAFMVKQITEVDYHIILIDPIKYDEATTEFIDDTKDDRAYQQIEFTIYGDDTELYDASAIVYTLSIERAIVLIVDYLQKEENKHSLKNGRDKQIMTIKMISAKQASINNYIDREFSWAYRSVETVRDELFELVDKIILDEPSTI